ncbi:MAG: helix-hairpin-helix domain-containing protein [Rikenellaceae bacterium]|jgi:DNA uptake protein ComE-like DNA-binding protein|nr:helix-hairpin-helix domain-containing protein [Rikenellaceae bacterium]
MKRFVTFLEENLGRLFRFSRSEMRGAWLLGALAVAVLLFIFLEQQRPETLATDSLAQTDAAADSLRRSRPATTYNAADATPRARWPEPFVFDPNTAAEADFVALGFSEKQARAILNYRSAGAVFRKPEDFSKSFVVSTAMYARLASYIRIGADFSQKTAVDHSARETRNKRIPSEKPTVYIELNTADSAALTTIRGIGPVFAARIVTYRARLGGFFYKSQLKEVYGITEENFSAIAEQFYLDTAVIQKINLNFVSQNVLNRHPYFTGSMTDRVVRGRQAKGGWKSIGDLTNNDILLPSEARKVAPYVVFE